MRKETIKAIVKEPGKAPEIREIKNELHELQALVGGYIEAVPIASDCVVICNEEGILMDLKFNITYCGLQFFGAIAIVGADGDEFTDVPEIAPAVIFPDFFRKDENK